MLQGAFSLLARSLRIDARSWPPHLTRLGLIFAIYVALCVTLATQNRFGAPGLRFFEGIAYLNVVFMTLLGLSFFSTSITEEKEEGTLGLMLMAGISPLGILAGKSGGRLCQALLLVAMQYPVMMLAVTMGGVTSGQIAAVAVALLAYMVLLAGFGLLCSTLAPNSRRAGAWVIVGLVAYVLVPVVAQTVSWFYKGWVATGGAALALPNWLWTFLESLDDICVFFRLPEILTTGFGQSPWSVQVLSNVGIGIFCAGLSWFLFGHATRNTSTEATTRGMVAKQRAIFRFHAGRPGINPFLWKDFHFVSGGIGMMLIRVMYYGGLALMVLCYEFVNGFPQQDDYVTVCLLWMSFSIAADAGLMLSRSLHEEVRGQTLAALLMLPRSATAMIYSKFAGALLGWIPGPIIEVLFTLSTGSGRSDFWGLFWDEMEIGVLMLLLLALIPHFAALTSLYVRWGAVPVAIGMMFFVYFLIIVGVNLLTNGGSTQDIAIVVVNFGLILICITCQIGVLLRTQSLAVR